MGIWAQMRVSQEGTDEGFDLRNNYNDVLRMSSQVKMFQSLATEVLAEKSELSWSEFNTSCRIQGDGIKPRAKQQVFLCKVWV